MKTLVLSAIRQLRLVADYECFLRDRGIQAVSSKGYISTIGSFALTIAEQSAIGAMAEADDGIWQSARLKNWDSVMEARERVLTARLLTLTRDEVCSALLTCRRTRSLSTMACFVSNVGQFFDWLKDTKVIPTNAFGEVRKKLRFKVGQLAKSIEEARYT